MRHVSFDWDMSHFVYGVTMLTGFEQCDEVPRSAKSKGRADAIRAFYESNIPVARKKFETKEETKRARDSYYSAARYMKLPVGVHMRGNYIYLERTDKE